MQHEEILRTLRTRVNECMGVMGSGVGSSANAAVTNGSVIHSGLVQVNSGETLTQLNTELSISTIMEFLVNFIYFYYFYITSLNQIFIINLIKIYLNIFLIIKEINI